MHPKHNAYYSFFNRDLGSFSEEFCENSKSAAEKQPVFARYVVCSNLKLYVFQEMKFAV